VKELASGLWPQYYLNGTIKMTDFMITIYGLRLIIILIKTWCDGGWNLPPLSGKAYSVATNRQSWSLTQDTDRNQYRMALVSVTLTQNLLQLNVVGFSTNTLADIHTTQTHMETT